MNQFDVYVTPASRLRRSYSHVVLIQSNMIDSGSDRLIAPLIPAHLIRYAGRSIPFVHISEVGRMAVLLPRMQPMRLFERGRPVANLADQQDAIKTGIDLLFFGV